MALIMLVPFHKLTNFHYYCTWLHLSGGCGICSACFAMPLHDTLRVCVTDQRHFYLKFETLRWFSQEKNTGLVTAVQQQQLKIILLFITHLRMHGICRSEIDANTPYYLLWSSCLVNCVLWWRLWSKIRSRIRHNNHYITLHTWHLFRTKNAGFHKLLLAVKEVLEIEEVTLIHEADSRGRTHVEIFW